MLDATMIVQGFPLHWISQASLLRAGSQSFMPRTRRARNLGRRQRSDANDESAVVPSALTPVLLEYAPCAPAHSIG